MKKVRYLLIVLLVFILSACNPANQGASPSPSIPASTPSPTAVNRVDNEHMTLTFAFGEREGTYSGEVTGGLPNGTGTFTSQNPEGVDWTYEGAWVNGHMEGTGKTIWSSGYMDEGLYKNDRLNGEGKSYFGDIRTYEGNYTDDEYDGKGTLYNQHGEELYSGDFDNGFLNESAADRKTRLTPFKKQCVAMSYKEMMNGGEKLEGAKIKVTGTILEIFEEDKGDEEWFEFYMSVGNNEDDYIGVDYRLSKGEKKFKEGDKVTMWGTLVSIYTETDEGKEYTYPYFDAYSVEAAPKATPKPTPKPTPVKTPVKTASVNSALYNTWICQQGQYTALYTFKKNGTYTGYFYDDMGDVSESGRYTVSGKTIRFSADQDYSYSVTYRFSGSKLILTYDDGTSSTFKVYEP